MLGLRGTLESMFGATNPQMKVTEALAEKWPDETTRELLAQRAVQDDQGGPRNAALQALAEKWPDETTLELLEAQVGTFEQMWQRYPIEDAITSLREKLSG